MTTTATWLQQVPCLAVQNNEDEQRTFSELLPLAVQLFFPQISSLSRFQDVIVCCLKNMTQWQNLNQLAQSELLNTSALLGNERNRKRTFAAASVNISSAFDNWWNSSAGRKKAAWKFVHSRVSLCMTVNDAASMGQRKKKLRWEIGKSSHLLWGCLGSCQGDISALVFCRISVSAGTNKWLHKTHGFVCRSGGSWISGSTCWHHSRCTIPPDKGKGFYPVRGHKFLLLCKKKKTFTLVEMAACELDSNGVCRGGGVAKSWWGKGRIRGRKLSHRQHWEQTREKLATVWWFWRSEIYVLCEFCLPLTKNLYYRSYWFPTMKP